MPRYKLDPFSPSGISIVIAPSVQRQVVQSPGYVVQGSTASSSPSVTVVPSIPTSGVEAMIYQVIDDPTKSYYFIGSHRYRIDATLDDPVVATNAGQPIGLLLALTYS